jgi:ribosomal protein L6P/L9E
MSRIGKLPIPVPSGVTATIDGQSLTVTGPKGSLNLDVATPITVAEGNTIKQITAHQSLKPSPALQMRDKQARSRDAFKKK